METILVYNSRGAVGHIHVYPFRKSMAVGIFNIRSYPLFISSALNVFDVFPQLVPSSSCMATIPPTREDPLSFLMRGFSLASFADILV